MHEIFTAASSIESPIYRVELGIKDIDSFLERQHSQKKLQQITRRDLESIEGSIVEIGRPALLRDLKLAVQSATVHVPPELESVYHNYDFGLIELPCAFLPVESQQFVYARLEVSFKTTPQSGQLLVYDIYPQQVEEQQANWSVMVEPNFRFSEDGPGTSSKPLVTVRGLRLEPRITASGVRKDRAIWMFEAVRQWNVRGLKTLYLIIQKPLGIHAFEWHFSVVAELKTSWGVLPVSVKRKLQEQENYTLLWPPFPRSHPLLSEPVALLHRQGEDKTEQPMSVPGRTRVFICYSHKDQKFRDELHVQLEFLARQNKLDFWDDTKIAAGAQWRKEIEQAIRSAKVAILLVSGYFLQSEFIAKDELPPLLDAAKGEGVVILPVIVSHCLFEDSAIARFQAVNDPSHPIDGMRRIKRTEVWVAVAKRIRNELSA